MARLTTKSASNLRTALTSYYKVEELQTLCADLGVDYENLSGDSKESKVRELVSYLDRTGRIDEFLEVVSRPPHIRAVNWSEIIEFESLSSSSESSPQPEPKIDRRWFVLAVLLLVILLVLVVVLRGALSADSTPRREQSKTSPGIATQTSSANATSTMIATATSRVNFVDSGQRLDNLPTHDVALADLDTDGDLDAFVANGAGLVVDVGNQVWINNGKARFSDSGQKLGSSTSLSVGLADVDNDGDLDAYIGTSGYDKGHRVWLNDGKGKFSDTGQTLANVDSTGVALGDLDGDSDIDVFIAARWSLTKTNEFNQVWFNDGKGFFRDSGQRLRSSSSTDVALGDLDGDNDLDAFVTNRDDSNTIWMNDGAGNFSNTSPCQTLAFSRSNAVALADIDKDGYLDAFVANAGSDEIWINDRKGCFYDSGQRLGNTESRDVAMGDFDSDNDIDAFVASNNGQESNTVWLNDGTGRFTTSLSIGTGSYISVAVAAGDLDGDKALDIFIGNNNGSDSVVVVGAPNFVLLNR